MRARLLQILEGTDSEIFRVAVSFDATDDVEQSNSLQASAFTVCDAQGQNIPADVRFLDCSCADDAHAPKQQRLVSISVPAQQAGAIGILYDGEKLCSISQEEHDIFCQARDDAMVNPAIDGRYEAWVEGMRLQEAPIAPLRINPLMSIVTPLFNTPANFLRELLDSILAQTYTDWELVLVNASPDNAEMQEVLAAYDDARIKVIELPKNLGIAGNTNAGIAAATGDYVSFVDHDDLIEPNLLAEFVAHIQDHPDVGVLYCDEDNFEAIDGGFFAPMYKPEFNADLLYTHNFVVHCLTVSRAVLEATERSSDETSGAQDWDLTIKAFEKGFEFGRIPKVLYHWRQHEGSTNGGKKEAKPYADAASIFVLEDHFKRLGLNASVEKTYIPHLYRPSFTPAPDTTLAIIDHAPGSSWDDVNEAIKACTEDNILVCTSGVQLPDTQGLAALEGFLQRSDVGVVAPHATFSDGLISHAGLCIDADGVIRFINQNFYEDMGGGYWGLAECSADYSAVFADCTMFRRETFNKIRGFVNYGDDLVTAVDFCFQIRDLGLSVVCTPNVSVIVDAPIPGFDHELDHSRAAAQAKLWETWGDDWKQDVLWSPNIDLTSGYPRLAIPKLSFVQKVKRKLRMKAKQR